MMPEGELEEIYIEADDAYIDSILGMLMAMPGVKSVERENSDIKIDSLSTKETDAENLSDQVWREYGDQLSRKTIGVDISFQEIAEMIAEEIQDD